MKHSFNHLLPILVSCIFQLCSCSDEDLKQNTQEEVNTPDKIQTNKAPQVEDKLMINDSLYADQWYLKNTGQFGSQPGIDINIEPVWQKGYKAEGMYVGILEYASHTHPDLSENLPKENVLTYALTSDYQCTNGHGTAIAGLIAARDNNIGTRGVAPRATLYSYAQENWTNALKRAEREQIAAYNASWTLNGNWGINVLTITQEQEELLEEISQIGFHGKGSSLVIAAGNSSYASPSNSPLKNHHTAIVVNSIFRDGTVATPGNLAGGGTLGTNLWLSAPTGTGFFGGARMITTDIIGTCGSNYAGDYQEFGMTSGAAPLVTGVIALIREVNSDLTWRDVKLILAESAKKVDLGDNAWKPSGKMWSNTNENQTYHRALGFGMVDAAKAIELASTWKLLPELKVNSKTVCVNKQISLNDTIKFSIESNLKFIESLNLDLAYNFSNAETFLAQNIELSLIAPDGTQAWFYNNNNNGEVGKFPNTKKLKLVTNEFLGNSNSNGEWSLVLKQNNKQLNQNLGVIDFIKDFKITIRGH